MIDSIELLTEDDIKTWLAEVVASGWKPIIICPLCRLEDCTCEGTD